MASLRFSNQQLRAQVPLERREAPAHGGVVDPELAPGRGQRAGARKLQKKSQIAPVQHLAAFLH
jgi:hypothetical protein